MGRRFLPVGILALLIVPAGSAADVQTSAKYVRNAIPAMEAYAADHGSYKGATLVKLRRYDRSLGQIRIRSATRRTYCIESTTRPFAHKAGPGATVNTGRCGQRGNEIRYDSPPPSSAPPITAEQRIRAAIPAMEAYAADHNGYARVTVAALRAYDTSIADVTIVRATSDTYCIESGNGVDERHKDGPGSPISAGPCPSAMRVLASTTKAPGEGQFHPNAADQKFARRAQLTFADLPSGTRRDPTRFANAFLLPRCAGYYQPDRTDLIASGVADAYFRTPYGSSFGSSVTVWRNHGEANAYWKRVFTPRYRVCLGRNLAAWHPRGIRARLIYAKQVAVRTSIGDRRAAYEVAVRYTTKTTSVTFVRAALFFQNDRAIGAAMAGGVRNACECTASLAGRVYARMRPTPRR